MKKSWKDVIQESLILLGKLGWLAIIVTGLAILVMKGF